MIKSLKKIVIFGLSLIIATVAVSAQVEEGQTIDKIIAIVGDEIVMQSDLDGSLMFLASQNPGMDINDPEIRKTVLDNLINEKLLVTKAIEDSIEISDEEINQQLDYLIQLKVQQLGSEKRVEDVYGISISRLRYEYRDEVKKQILSEKYRQQKLSGIKTTPNEVVEFYNEYVDSLPNIPAQVELYHIVKNIEADNAAKKDIFKLARSVRDSIINGSDFGELAARYSGDPGTKNEGGDLGWVNKGKFYPEFEKAAFSLNKDEISIPVETPFGYHIIQTLEKRDDAMHCRHILFRLGQSGEDREKAKNVLLDLKKKFEEGESFEKLAKENSDDKDTKGFGGFIGKVRMTEMPGNFRQAIETLPEGGVSEPLPYSGDPTKQAYHIILKKKVIPEHKPTLKDDYAILERMADSNKKAVEYQKLMEQIRSEIYWEIKD